MRPRPRATTADGHEPNVVAAPDAAPTVRTTATTNAARPADPLGAAGAADALGRGDEHRAGTSQPSWPNRAAQELPSPGPQASSTGRGTTPTAGIDRSGRRSVGR